MGRVDLYSLVSGVARLFKDLIVLFDSWPNVCLPVITLLLINWRTCIFFSNLSCVGYSTTSLYKLYSIELLCDINPVDIRPWPPDYASSLCFSARVIHRHYWQNIGDFPVPQLSHTQATYCSSVAHRMGKNNPEALLVSLQCLWTIHELHGSTGGDIPVFGHPKDRIFPSLRSPH
jgi:hypothetical protein